MNLILLVILSALIVFAVGVLVGSGLVTSAQDARDRRQAATQRDINGQ